MFGKKSWGGGALTSSVSLLGALSSACLDRPLCADCHPETTNQFVMRVPTNGIDKIDLLFMIDNSGSMADKQAILSAAVPSLLSRFVSPLCLDENGKPNGGHLRDGRCAQGVAEFPPIGDIHIGVITSSLGIPGGTGTCARFDKNGSLLPNDDRAWLLPKARATLSLPSWNSSGFLAWDPNGDKNTPPGTRAQQDLQRDFQNLVEKTDEAGCGFEASLESWYRFLIDPQPPESTRPRSAASLNSEAVGIDNELLAQRAAFLRPDSLVAILMLTDENDCSLRIGMPTVAMGSQLPRGTSVCATNPDDPCCRPCAIPETSPPTGCTALSEDPECKKGTGWYTSTEAPANLNCFDQKRRFGMDLLEPTDKYVRGLTSSEVPNRDGVMVANPLFAPGKGKPARDFGRVFLAGIVGVPWQDIATNDTRTGSGLRYMTAAELRASGRWDMILGNPKTRTPPTDPHMIESVKSRSGSHPLLASAGSIASVDSNSPTADLISGHEQKSDSDLQYACIFELESPVDCSGKSSNCDCDKPETQSPLCQPPGGGPVGTTQYYAKAYPGTRHLEVLKGIGDQAIVASICPKVARSPSPNDDPNYGYNPAVTAIVDTLRPSLANQCLSRAPTVQDDGRSSCRVLETRFTNDCDCKRAGRTDPNEDQVASVRATLKNDKMCDTPETPACSSLCACEIVEAEHEALDKCRSTVEASAQNPGYCYVDPQKGLGDPALVRGCPATQQRLLRLVGPDTPRTGSLTFMACIGQPNTK